jgi:hypothetical protein
VTPVTAKRLRFLPDRLPIGYTETMIVSALANGLSMALRAFRRFLLRFCRSVN